MKNKTKLNLNKKDLTEQKNLKSKNKTKRIDIVIISLTTIIILLLGWDILTTKEVKAQEINSVSGSISDGGSLSVIGEDFGSHDVDVQWLGGKNGIIESGVNGTSIANFDNWVFGQQDNAFFSNDFSHSGLQSLKCENIAMACDLRFDYGSSIGANEEVFVSWWVRKTQVGLGQWKLFRLNWQNDIQDDSPQVVMFNWYNANQMIFRPGPTTSGNTAYSYPGYPEEDNKWYRMDFYYDIGNYNTPDSFMYVTLYDPESNILAHTNDLSNFMGLYDSSRNLRWFLWQNYKGNGITEMDVWIDDIFIQVGSQSRVELCDDQLWGSRINCEIQIPTSWSTSSIDITLNQGSFSSGDTVYLYVVDENGDVNEAGYPITIGGTTIPQCSDTIDNDSDGLIDYPNDPGCTSAEDNDETDPVTIRADVDQQNGITSTDAMLTLRNSLGLDMSQTNWQTSDTTGDVNCDNVSNSTDAMLILRYSLGLDMSGTAWCE